MPPLPLAFGFANAAVLGWLAAAAAPILIHLWMKRTRRETRWAAVRFLQAAIERHARRLRIQEWILLAMRTALVLLVVFAASKPVIESLGGLLGAGVQTHRVLAIDQSFSMRYQTEDGAQLEAARALAADLVEQSGPADRFTLVLFGGPEGVIVGQTTTDASAIATAIAEIEPTDGAVAIAELLPMLGEVVQDDQRVAADERVEIVILSDLTAGGWQGIAEADEASPLARQITQLAERAELLLVDVGQGDATNWAATDIRLIDGLPTLRTPTRIAGLVQRFGPSSDSREPATVELVVDDLVVASQQALGRVDLPVPVEFVHSFRRPGPHAVEIRIAAEDGLGGDNARRLGVDIRSHIRVLCIEGAPSAARYLTRALNPTGAANAPIQSTVVSDARLSSLDLAQYDAVFLCNVAEFSRGEADRLADFARSGRGVAFFFGDRVRPDRYNAALGSRVVAGEPVTPIAEQPPPEPLLPVVLGESVSGTSYGVDPLEYEHPIVAPFQGRERAGLLTTPIERYIEMRVASTAPSAEVAIALPSGDPLLVTAQVGAGRVAVFATAASLASTDAATGRPWTAMPAWPSFVPIVRETTRYLTAADAQRPTAIVGTPIAGRAVAGDAVQIEDPEGAKQSVATRLGREEWLYTRTDTAGFYRIGTADAETPLRIAAVNILAAESDLTRVSFDALPDAFRPWRAHATSTGEAQLAPPAGVHRGLLLAAILLAIVETLFAAWVGRSKA